MSTLANIRNIGIIAHIDAGKTTVTERMLYLSGRSHRMGEVDDGSTVMDYLDEERQRGITIVSAAASFPWQGSLIHLIDTPGHIDFTVEVERSLRVIDGAVVIFSGVEGVEAQSEKVWLQADGYQVPRLAMVNKLDRVGADFDRVLGEINDKFGGRAVAIQRPVGIESDFRAVIDLITMELCHFEPDQTHVLRREPLPEDLIAEAAAGREAMIARLADEDDELADLYLSEAEVVPELLHRCLRRLTLANTIIPVLTGSAKKTIGVQPLLDAIVSYLPSPGDLAEVTAEHAKSGDEVVLAPDAAEPFAGLVFKVVASKSADLYYLRTYAGTLKRDDNLYVPRTGETIRAKRLLRLYAKSTEAVDEVGPGDIVGLVGPRDIVTGDTICSRQRPVLLERIQFPEAVISMALEPRSSKDRARMEEVLGLLCREDPSLTLSTDDNTGQSILSGMGELHLEIAVKRIVNEFATDIRAGEPRVAYRETIATEVTETANFDKTIGDTDLAADVTITLRPATDQSRPGQVTSKLRPGTVPKQLLKVALAALSDALKTGGNQGYPLIYVDAELNALTLHGERSTDGAILGAVLQATDQAISSAGTQILEPVMDLEITTPEDHVGEVSNELQTRRAVIHTVADVLAGKRVVCEVPLAEMFGFSKALPKLTGGRGSFSMEPHGYRPLR